MSIPASILENTAAMSSVEAALGAVTRSARSQIGQTLPTTRVRRRGNPQGKYLFDAWSEVAKRVGGSNWIALFLDFDGTLAPFRIRPENVRLAQSTRRVLARLARHPRIQTWIISGRRRADIRKRIGVQGIQYWGLHGSENGERPLRGGRSESYLRAARRKIAGQIRGLRNVWIEDKKRSFAIHYRGASPSQARRAQGVVRNVLRQFSSDLRCLAGDSAWELIPRNAGDKGTAVRRVLRRLGGSPLAIYVGDDGSDELAFEALRGQITVCVARRRRTKARYAVRNISEVRRFLRILLKEVGA